MSQKILVVIDGTALSKQALETALCVAKRKQAAIDILFMENRDLPALSFGFTMITSLSFAGYVPVDQCLVDHLLLVRQESEELLKQFQREAERERVEYTIIYIEGRPSSKVEELLQQNRYEFIIVGDQRVQKNRKRMFRHVNRKMDQFQCCPVLIMQ
ncbi:universal stress protein [Paenibacillus sp. 1001270B_150601_E10]|uniref:universal stress protein n=1 Tax=Paenibacillus sp. 1001270B_150601_E10 TaxID=2787079 RepID=UPI00189C948F|nr:universal stress protein [Paenibacillus sp. 1001270B_150601_E10]